MLTLLAGSHVDRLTGQPVNNFLNSYTLIQTATDASFFAIMAVGATIVIISGGIDLSVGLGLRAGRASRWRMVLRAHGPRGTAATVSRSASPSRSASASPAALINGADGGRA